MLLADVVTTSAEVGAQSSRLAKVTRIAHLLSEAARDIDARGVAVIVSWLSGELPQRQIGVGWAALRSLPPPSAAPVLTVAGVDAAFTAIGATSRQGFAGAPRRVGRRSVRRRNRGRADVSAPAAGRRTATGRAGRCDGRRGRQGGRHRRADGPAGGDARRRSAGRRRRRADRAAPPLSLDFTLQVGRPVGPMLAQTATGVADALEQLGGTAVFEAKLDGARVQIHRAATT